MKRLHAILIFTYLAACVCLMLGREAWRYARKRKRHGMRRM